MRTLSKTFLFMAVIMIGGCTGVQNTADDKNSTEGTPVRILSYVGDSVFLGSGSFLIVDGTLFFVTAYHVTEDSDRIVLQTFAEDVIKVELIRFYSNKAADISVFIPRTVPEDITPYTPKFHYMTGKTVMYGFPEGKLVTVNTEIAANVLLMHEDCKVGMSGGPVCQDGFQIGFVHALQSDGKSVVMLLQKNWFFLNH